MCFYEILSRDCLMNSLTWNRSLFIIRIKVGASPMIAMRVKRIPWPEVLSAKMTVVWEAWHVSLYMKPHLSFVSEGFLTDCAGIQPVFSDNQLIELFLRLSVHWVHGKRTLTSQWHVLHIAANTHRTVFLLYICIILKFCCSVFHGFYFLFFVSFIAEEALKLIFICYF